MTPERIVVLAPRCVTGSDRYEELMFRIFHHWPESTIVEKHSLPKSTKSIAQVVFVRDEDHCIDTALWIQLAQAAAGGMVIHMARMDSHNCLVLVPWRELVFEDHGSYVQVNYSRPGAKKREREKVSA